MASSFKHLFYILCAASLLAGTQSHADSLFYETCAAHSASLESPSSAAQIILVSGGGSGFAGLSCQELKSDFEAAQVIGMALLPVSIVLRTPGVKEELAANLAELGLTLANPAILGVTVIGSVGVVTVYFVMKASLKECEERERQQFRQDLLDQVKKTYPGVTGENVPLDIQPEEGGT